MSALPQAMRIPDGRHQRRRVDQLDKGVHGKPVAKQLRARDQDKRSSLFGHLKWRLRQGRAQGVMRRLQVVPGIVQCSSRASLKRL
jgi:hypothetical protein